MANQSYPRIRRDLLVVDTNVTDLGSIQTPVQSVIDDGSSVKLKSRINYNSDVSIASGYCICIDRNNPKAYIETQIPSTERGTYDIYIKLSGGNADLLYVDDKFDNIIIRPKVSLTNVLTDKQVIYISYIAFKNRTTGKIDHLFECEEGSGNLLYDAVTGQTATIQNVASVSSIRRTNSTKEWISDVDNNLDNEINLGGCQFKATNYLKFRGEMSVTFRLKISEDDITKWSNTDLIYNADVSHDGFGIGIYKDKRIVFNFCSTDESGTLIKLTATIPASDFKDYLDYEWHDYAFIVNSTGIYSYIDGELKASATGSVYPYNTPQSQLCVWRNGYSNQDVNYRLKELSVFNIDITKEGSKYTLSDFTSGKSIPVSMLSMSYDDFNGLYASGVSSSSGTTSISGKVVTFDNYVVPQQVWSPTKPTSTQGYISINPGSKIHIKLKVDAYIKKVETDTIETDSLPNLMYRLFVSNTIAGATQDDFLYGSDYVTKTFSYKITNSSGEVLASVTKDNMAKNPAWLPSKYIYKGTTESDPRYLDIDLELYDNFFSNSGVNLGTNKIVVILFNSRGGVYSITGTIELLDVWIEGCQASYDQFLEYRLSLNTSQWVDKTNNNLPLKLNTNTSFPNNPNFASKNYGTWLSNVGYSISDGVNIPRKVL